MAGSWDMFRTGGAPAFSRICTKDALLAVSRLPALDLCDGLEAVDEYALGLYAETPRKARLARAMEIQASAPDIGSFGSTYRRVKRSTRLALVKGDLRLANGMVEQPFNGGQPRMALDYKRWERKELPDLPIQIKRMREFEKVGIDGVDFPSNAAVDMHFGFQVGRPIVISMRRFRQAEREGRVSVLWLP